jgi:hypothetical protein
MNKEDMGIQGNQVVSIAKLQILGLILSPSGLDVLCHGLESYTAVPFNKRIQVPPNPTGASNT